MREYKDTWLPHLKNAIPNEAKGNRTCMYAMALEGWRRGLKLKFIIKPGKSILRSVAFSLNDGNTEHVFNGSRGDKVTKEAIKHCMHKQLTNKCLDVANVPIPGGKAFKEGTSDEKILQFANEFGYPVVIKPSASDGGGVGVITDIKNEEEMKKALSKVRLKPIAVIVERFFTGEDFRVYVLEDQVIGAFHRRAASVVGDGKSNIKTLIDKKNVVRQSSPFLTKSNIKINEQMELFLEGKGLSLNSVPSAGERVYVRRNGEYFGERDAINVTDSISPTMKKIAVSAVKAIPGLKHGGVDMLINAKKDIGVVNEVNSRAQISNHIFPMEGEAVDIPKHLIDYYFPETANDKVTDVNYNFDFKPVIQKIKEGKSGEVKIPDIPIGLKSVKRYVVTGSNFDSNYRNYIKQQALKKNLNGYIRTINGKSVSVVVAGSEYVVNAFKNVIKNPPSNDTEVLKVETKKFTRPVTVGFALRKNKKYDAKRIPQQQTSSIKKNSEEKKQIVNLLNRAKRIAKKVIGK